MEISAFKQYSGATLIGSSVGDQIIDCWPRVVPKYFGIFRILLIV